MRLRVLTLLAMSLAACTAVANIDTRQPAETTQPKVPKGDAGSNGQGEPSDQTSSDGGTKSNPPETDGATRPEAGEALLAGLASSAYAIGVNRVFYIANDVRTRLMAVDKTAPYRVSVLHEEDILDGIKISAVAASRGRVFFSWSEGTLRSMGEDGSRADYESSFALTSTMIDTPTTLWLVERPRFIGEGIRFFCHECGDAGSPIHEPKLGLVTLTGDDDSMVYAATGGIFAWTPAKGNDARRIAELPKLPLRMGLSPTTAFAAIEGEGVVAFNRTTGARRLVMAQATGEKLPVIKANDTHLFLLRETMLERCEPARCAETRATLASGFAKGHRLTLDGDDAYFASIESDGSATVRRTKVTP